MAEVLQRGDWAEGILVVETSTLDFELLSALKNRPGPYEVFVRLRGPVTDEEASWLSTLGLRGILRGQTLLTGELSEGAVASLSGQDFVASIRLTSKLNVC